MINMEETVVGPIVLKVCVVFSTVSDFEQK